MTFAIDPAPIRIPFDNALFRLRNARFADALWSRRLDIWTTDAGTQQKIAARLGWLRAIDVMQPEIPRLRRLADSIRASDVTDVVLLGMGGSSLAPEVIRAVIGPAAGFPRFHVLDSIDPDAIRDTLLHPPTTLFIVASKSGSTIEVASLASEAERLVRDAGVDPSARFIAITDEGTVLHQQAVARRFRDLFLNPSDIGGRYAALSFFGLVPAALMGVDLAALLASAQSMADACRVDDPELNPGLMLGAAMAAGAHAGRDKLVVCLPKHLSPFGLWIEQLVAESTGKHGTGIVPVLADEHQEPAGDDCLQVSAHATGATDLGGAFLQWEIATATAGFLLDINPFDEPNVQQAKDATRALLATYEVQRRLPVAEPHASFGGARMTFSAAAQERMARLDAGAFLDLLQHGDYFGLLAYVPPGDERFTDALRRIQSSVSARTGCVATVGYGPRYLHSTGQLHKGGPNTGVFVVLTAAPDSDRPVPNEPYSFGVLEAAQALGDFQSLDREGRRAMHLHLPQRDPALLSTVFTGA